MAHVIMIASGKGGTGKSTFAAYLSAELAYKKKKTLLIELDAGLRSIDVISGTDRQAVYDLGDILSGACTPEKAMIVSPYTENLYIIAAPYKSLGTDFTGFKSVVDSVYTDFDFIVIDTAAGLGTAFQAACNVSVTGIVVVTPDIISVRDGRIVSDEMSECGINDIRLVINKFSVQTFRFSGFEDMDDIIDQTCARLLAVIPMSQQIAVSAISGEQLSLTSVEKQIFSAAAQRIMGKDIQIII
jgi:septum site-determining protein MinD